MKSDMESASRIRRWFGTGPRCDDAYGEHGLLPAVTPPDLGHIRSVMLGAVASCSEASRVRIEDQLKHATSAVELWLIRADIFQCLAREVGQKHAAQQVAELAPLFKDALPGVAAAGKSLDNRRDAPGLY
ncbi:MAG: hypothetical protein V4573_07570 [Pseudomonadota bacterium]